MARTDNDRVKAVLRLGSQGGDYDDENNPALDRFIAAAYNFTNRVDECATRRDIDLTDDELIEIETWMAAHFYSKSDRVYSSKSTDGASASFVLDPKVPEPYKAGAIEMDPSGCVAALLNRQVARVHWAGKTETEQRTYDERN